MKKILFVLPLFLPFLLSAQLDKIRPGMSLSEFRANFPAATHDYGAMTSYVYANEVHASVKGVATFTISHDTVGSYWFQSQRTDGPCDRFPAADSVGVLRLLTAARTLAGHYTDMFGEPREKKTQPLNQPDPNSIQVTVYLAKWKTASGELIVVVSRPGKSEEISAANAYVKPNVKEENSCSYVFEVIATGKGREFRSEFGNGYSIDEFKLWKPYLANQVKTFPDCWRMSDETTVKNGVWHFEFTGDKLSSFTFDLYNGINYGHPTEQAYAALRDRALQLAGQADAQFGKADSASAVFPEKYKAPKGSKNYYSIVNYYSRWKSNGTAIVLEMDEDGGGKQGEPVFHLVLYSGERRY